jgi:hypothetical protein
MKLSVEKSRAKPIIVTRSRRAPLPTWCQERYRECCSRGVRKKGTVSYVKLQKLKGKIGLFQIVWDAVPHSFHLLLSQKCIGNSAQISLATTFGGAASFARVGKSITRATGT